MAIILGLESSCDETAAALVRSDRKILSHALAGQEDHHRAFGGVVPEIAARAHAELMTPLVATALADAGMTLDEVDAIAATAGPGLIGGVMVGRDIEFMRTKATKIHRMLGGNSNGFDAFLLVNGMKTLELRMERHCANATRVAEFLQGHPQVAFVNYNGLTSHPDHAVAQKQMRHPGAMLSFDMKGGLNAGITVMNRLKLCTRTVSLGTCDTLLCHPASMTHYSVPREDRIRYGITDGLIRMSLGMENIEDILADLHQALDIAS